MPVSKFYDSTLFSSSSDININSLQKSVPYFPISRSKISQLFAEERSSATTRFLFQTTVTRSDLRNDLRQPVHYHLLNNNSSDLNTNIFDLLQKELNSLHEENILHMDIFPTNIIFDAEKLHLIDFTLSQVFDANKVNIYREYIRCSRFSKIIPESLQELLNQSNSFEVWKLFDKYFFFVSVIWLLSDWDLSNISKAKAKLESFRKKPAVNNLHTEDLSFPKIVRQLFKNDLKPFIQTLNSLLESNSPNSQTQTS